MSIRFEWDPKKAETNQAKHRVSFEEAITVFADPLARIFPDKEHSVNELREIIIGHSAQHQLILVHFTGVDELREIIIGHSARQQIILVNFTGIDDRVRIFSARKATRRERKDYEENVGQ